jgi:dihydrofolate reductase
MRRVLLQMGVSLDGLVAGLDSDESIVTREDDEVMGWKVASLHQVGTHIMGRTTYEQIAAHWPSATDAYAPR